jgi:serine/threonine-protein kinase
VFDVAGDVAVFRQGEDSSDRLLYLLDGSGKEQKQIGDADNYDSSVSFSPDGRSILAGIFSGVGGTADLWALDVERATRTRLTFDPGHENSAIWSPDGSRIAFTARHNGITQPMIRKIVGDAQERPASNATHDTFLAGWSPDSRYLVGHELGSDAGGQGRLVAIPLVEGAPDPLADQQLPSSLRGAAGLYQIAFSPDGKWMAYESSEAGRQEISAIPFGRTGRPWQITLNGGSTPRWVNGFIYFIHERTLWRIPVTANESSLVVGTEEAVYDDRWVTDFDVTADGRRMVIECNDRATERTTLSLLLNWQALLPTQR